MWSFQRNLSNYSLTFSHIQKHTMDKYNFEVIEFNYYNKIFGNIVLRIKKEDKDSNSISWIYIIISSLIILAIILVYFYKKKINQQ